MTKSTPEDKLWLKEAVAEARKGLAGGGIPIGSVLVHRGKIIGRGHNQRVQQGSAILHAEMAALENAGRLPASVYAECTLVSTLSPCPMCSGAAVLFKIPRIVVGENHTFQGPEDYVRSTGAEIVLMDDEECRKLMEDFIRSQPSLWNEDIAEPDN
jgi:creatinine deaminase